MGWEQETEREASLWVMGDTEWQEWEERDRVGGRKKEEREEEACLGVEVILNFKDSPECHNLRNWKPSNKNF